MKTLRGSAILLIGVQSMLAFQPQSSPPGGDRPVDPADKAPRTLAPYFVPATPVPKATDPDGFLQRWLLLEPINKLNRTNTVFTDSYVRNAFTTEYFPDQFTTAGWRQGQNRGPGTRVACPRFYALQRQTLPFRVWVKYRTTYGVIFWAVTTVHSPREISNARMAVGVNGAAIWWLNGEEVVDLFTDRRMKMDDCVSKRLTIHKGRNVIRGAVINGPGMSDFCVRFLDEEGDPIRDLTVNLGAAGK